MSGLSDAQVDMLLQPIAGARVHKKDNQSHVEAYDIRRRLTNIFGFAGWGEESRTELIYESFDVTVGSEKKPGVEVGYKATCTLTVYGAGPNGQDVRFTEEAFGGQKMGRASRGDVHDFAIKTAESQAFKRAAVCLGDQFGLSLYNGGSLAPLVVSVPGARLVTPGVWDAEHNQWTVQRDSEAQGDHVTEPLAVENADEQPPTSVPGGDDTPPVDPPGTDPTDEPTEVDGQQTLDDVPDDDLPAEAAQYLIAAKVDQVVVDRQEGVLTQAEAKRELRNLLLEAGRLQMMGAVVGDRTLEAKIADANRLVK